MRCNYYQELKNTEIIKLILERKHFGANRLFFFFFKITISSRYYIIVTFDIERSHAKLSNFHEHAGYIEYSPLTGFNTYINHAQSATRSA